MTIYNVKISQKGQVTIPTEVRKLIGLEPGGRVQFITTETGKVEVVAKKRGIGHLTGIFDRPSGPIDIDTEIQEEVWERNRPPNPRRPQ
jgi:AbrB family looped-hinge helix DNA binding protein